MASATTVVAVAVDSTELTVLAAEALRLVGIDAERATALALTAIAAAQRSHDAPAESMAWRARGLAAREREQLEDAESALRTAIALGGRAGKERTAQARMSLALVLLDKGDLRSARRMGRLAVTSLQGSERARAQVQLALIEQRSGALEESLKTYATALSSLQRAGDSLWEARLRNNRGILHAYQGRTGAAERDLARAEELHLALGQTALAADCRWNLGFVASLKGEAVTALERFGQASAVWDLAGAARGVRFLDRCQVLLSVGLVEDAKAAVEVGIRELGDRAVGSDLAEAVLLQSQVLLAVNDRDGARSAALSALAALETQGRKGLGLLARYALLAATAEDPDAELWRDAAEVQALLRSAGWPVEAADITLMMVRRAWASGSEVDEDLMAFANASTRSGPAGQRIRGWHALALGRLSQGQPSSASRALLAGLRVYDRHQMTLGAAEFRVRSAVQAQALADAGLRLAVSSGRPTRIFDWLERWRAGSLLVRPVRPPSDATLVARLSELRAVSAALERARSSGEDVSRWLHQEQSLERAVTDRARVIRAETWRDGHASRAALRVALNGAVLVEYLQVDDALGAVVFAAGRWTLHWLASASEVGAEIEALRFALTRISRGGSPRALAAADATRSASAVRLDQLLLRPIPGQHTSAPLVLVPTGVLHALPWALLPSADTRAVTVAPSASVWLAAAVRPGQKRGQIVVAAGPGLPASGREVAAIADAWGGHALVQSEATAATLLSSLGSARCAHIAAHGRFRSDNPLFSSLLLTDGPLTVHDLETVARMPETVVLSACEGGLSSVHPGEELMGLSSSILRLGAKALVASVTAVPDEVATALMSTFHRLLSRGVSPAEALVAARLALPPEDRAAAAAFVCFGAG